MATPSEPIIYRRPLTLSNSVELYWYPPLNNGGNVITSYIIESANIPYINILSSTDRKSIITNLTIGNTYYFTIKATNINGNSNIAEFNFVIPGFKPLNPSNINITNDLSNIYFSLNNPLDIGNSSLTYNTVTFNPLDMYGNISNISAFTYNQSSYGSNIIDPLNTKFLNSNFSYKCFIQSINTVNDSDKNYFDPYINTKIPTNGLKLWLDPYDRSTLTISNNIVTKLVDKSGNKSNAFIIEPFGPSYDSSNCLLNFNGLQYLTLPDNTIPSGNSSYSIFMYVSTSNILRNEQWFLYSGTPTANLSLGGLINSNLLIHSWFGNQQTSNTNISANISYLIEYTYSYAYTPNGYDSGIRRSFLNGSLVGLENIGSRNSTGSNNLIATNSNLTANLVGSIGDIIIYNRILSNDERNSVRGYLERKKNNVSLQNVGNLVSWLDATDSDFIYNSNLESKIDYGSKVFTWLDRSRANNNATQSNISVLPTRRPFVQNNLDVLEFNQSYLTIPSAYYPLDAFIVLKLANISDINGIIGISPNSNNYSSLSDVSGSRWAIDATSNSLVASTTETSSNFLLMEWSIGNNNNYIRRYGSNIANVTTGTWTLPNNSNIIIGNANGFDFTKRFKGFIGEIIMFNKQLDDGDRYPVEGYLAWKWGLQTQLPSDHPYKNSAPYLFYKYLTISSNISPTVSSLFSPANITTGLWLDASDTQNLTLASNKVSTWIDKSGNGRNFSQSTTANRPTYSSTGLNNKPTLIFGNSYVSLLRNASQMGTLASSSTLTVFYVAQRQNSPWEIVFTNWFNSDGFSDTLRFHLSMKHNLVNAQTLYVNNVTVAEVGTTATGANYIGGFSFAGLNIQSYLTLNGTISTFTPTVSMPSSLSSTNSAFVVGDHRVGPISVGAISEIIAIDRYLESYDRQKIEGYLAWKWGLQSSLPTTHLFKSAAPTNDFHPMSITGLQLWLDGNDTSTMTLSGQSVTQWNDKSGQNNNATGFGNHNATGNLPQLFTNGLNNKTIINLSGANDYFKVNNNFNIRSSTYIILVKILAVPTTSFVRYGIMSTDTPNFHGYGIGFYGNTTDVALAYKFEIINNNSFTNTTLGIDTSGNTWYILTITYNNTTTAVFSSNGTSTNVAIDNQTPDNTDGLKIGIWNTSYTTNTSCYVAEAMLYNSALVASDRQRIEGYLAWKWGLQSNLPTNHPYKNTAP